VRLSYTFNEGSQVAATNQNGIPAAGLFSDDYEQLDFSSSFDLGELFGWQADWAPTLTFDVVNITDEEQRTYFQFRNATFTSYAPGTQFMVGLRGSF
jgi:outer membrane receptor protein involved in Fe transport